MNNTEYQEVIVCDCCKKPYAKWHHANQYNSSKFCDICGSYCSTRTLANYEIKRLKMKVFVYGSLKQCGWNHSLLSGSHFLGKAYTRGYTLYHVSSYPGMIKSENQYEQVFGELYDVDSQTLARLDMLESEGFLYRRDTIKVRYNNENIDAYAYIYLLDTDYSEKVAGNNWEQDSVFKNMTI